MPKTEAVIDIRTEPQAKIGEALVKSHVWKAPTGHHIGINIIISVILGLLVFFMFGIGLVYMYVTPAEILPDANRYNVTANGVTAIEVQAIVKNILTLPMKYAKVSVTTDMGKVENKSSTTNYNGYCTVLFTPHKSLQQKDATVEFRAGDAEAAVQITMLPDYPKEIMLSSSTGSLPANGYSTTTITVTVADDVNATVPDNTLVSFNILPPDSGKLSGSTCYTINGRCTISLISSTNPSKARVSANSYSAGSHIDIAMTKLPPKYLVLQSDNSSVVSDGSSTIVLTAMAMDELTNPVDEVQLTFSTDRGTLSAASCKTDSSGQCQLVFTAPDTSGTARITAKAGGTLTTSKSINLIPISVVKATIKLNKNLGNPIIPGFVQSLDYLGKQMVQLRLANTGSGAFRGSARLEITGWSDAETNAITIPAGSNTVLNLSPPLNTKALTNLNTVQVSYRLTLTDSDGKTILEQTEPATLAPYNTMIWGAEYDPLVSAWVTPNSPAIHQLLSDAAAHTPWNSMSGYQQVGSYTQDEITYYQFKAIYNALQAKGMRYVNAPESFTGTQTVYTPSQSLAVNGGNCIDGTLVFASAFTSMGMRPVIALTPTHAFICVATWSDSNRIICAETTMIGSGKTFQEAYNSAANSYTKHKSAGTLTTVDVKYYLSNGVKPLPS